MLEPWNNATILPPPVNTFSSKCRIDIEELIHACNHISKVLSKQSPLHEEAALMSRFIYKFDRKFRNDMGYKRFKKINTAIRKYLKLNLLKDVDNFKSVLPSDENNSQYYPTRQMLEYILVRLMTFSKLMLRIYVCTKQAAVFYIDRVKRGESHWMSLMPYALVSRIYSLSIVLLQHSCTWYKLLYLFLDKFQLKGLPFLPHDYKLPSDLEVWLDMKNLDTFGTFEWSKRKMNNIIPSFDDEFERDTFDNILNLVNEINEDEVCDDKFKLKTSSVIQSDTRGVPFQPQVAKTVDCGEVICRKSFQSLQDTNFAQQAVKSISGDHTVQKELVKKFNNSHTIQKVTNKPSLQEFIDKEEELRNNDDQEALTSHLTFMQWQALKNNLLQLLESLSNNRKIERKFVKIWKEKCLIYC